VRVLALETTEALGSVALMADGNLLAQLNLDPNQRSAQSLAPALSTILKKVGWRPADVRLVAVSIGPGSFTGLRVGVTAAKTFAYAVRADILGIDTLEAVAAGAPPEVAAVSVAIDAQRGDVVAQSFRRRSDGWFEPADSGALLPVDEWLQRLPPGTTISGPALRKFAPQVPAGLTVLAPQYWPPTAAAVARLAARYYAEGRRDDLWTLVPHYSRPSAAEEKWDKLGR